MISSEDRAARRSYTSDMREDDVKRKGWWERVKDKVGAGESARGRSGSSQGNDGTRNEETRRMPDCLAALTLSSHAATLFESCPTYIRTLRKASSLPTFVSTLTYEYSTSEVALPWGDSAGFICLHLRCHWWRQMRVSRRVRYYVSTLESETNPQVSII